MPIRRRKLNPVTGQKFNKLKIIDIAESNKDGRCRVIVECECGKIKTVQYRHIEKGSIKSCGCLIIKHGLDKHPLAAIWRAMKARCYSKKSISYKNYGGKGIKICKQWRESLPNFIEWMEANGWEKGMQIDRKNNKGNYSPCNCRVVTVKANQNNRSNNRKVFYNGKYRTIAELSDEYKISYDKLYQRLFKLKWPIERAINIKRAKSKKPESTYNAGAI